MADKKNELFSIVLHSNVEGWGSYLLIFHFDNQSVSLDLNSYMDVADVANNLRLAADKMERLSQGQINNGDN